MTISIREDDGANGGYAFVDLGKLLPEMNLQLSFRRLDPEPRNLGREGWQAEVAWLEPLAIEQKPATTIVRIGPMIVNRIEELVPIEIHHPKLGMLGRVYWPALTPAPHAMETAVLGPEDARLNLRDITGPGSTTEDKEPVRESGGGAPEKEKTGDGKGSETQTGGQQENPKSGSKLWLWLLVAAIIAAIAGGAYFATQKKVVPTPDPVPVPPVVVPDSTTRLPAGPTAAQLQAEFDGLTRSRAGSAAFTALGVRAIAAGHGQVAFKAFDEADPNRDADAAWHMARFFDPRETNAAYRNFAIADAKRAAQLYSLWRRTSEKHSTELRGLCDSQPALRSSDPSFGALCRGGT